jgi:two-component system cell cycle response regulator DivK
MHIRRTVLVVEDNGDLREFFQVSLRAAGYDARTAADGLRALAIVDTMRPDLIVLDLGLPKVSGREVLGELEAQPHLRGIPVVIVTASADQPTNPNVKCHLRKPVTADTLISTIERCLIADEPQR